MRNTYAIVLLLSITSIHAQWTQLVHPTIERGDDLYFLNADTGWVAGGGSGRILRTYDGGDFWWIVADFGDNYLRSIEFLDAQVGFCGSLDGQLYRTTDGGTTWTDIMPQLTQQVPGACGLARADASTIYGTGVFFGPAYVIKSSDAGLTWQHFDLSAQAWCLIDVLFLNADTGFVVGGAQNSTLGASIFRTIDGGLTWTQVFTTGAGNEWFWKIQSPDGQHLFASIETGYQSRPRIARSNDAGLTWTLDTLANGFGRLQGVGFLDPQRGWAGDNVLFSTTNGGESWSSSFQLPGFNRFHKVNDQLAFAGGYGLFRYGPLNTGLPQPAPVAEVRDRLTATPLDASTLRIDVDLHNSGYSGIRIHGTLGAVVKEVNNGRLSPGPHSFTVDISDLASGTYHASLYTNLGFVSQPVVKP
ncbi:MAG: YCF48-related protein [Flavobacteriales bacterium]|jgi:photosystem II stability/assembly factor-like uncharacterized protein|nr:YCF48-related protein [Flavobacteriales bacterium]